MASAPALAAGEPPVSADELYTQALEASQAGEQRRAVGLLEKAYAALAGGERASDRAFEIVVEQADFAYRSLFESGEDVRYLQADVELLDRYLAALSQHGDPSGGAHQQRAEAARAEVQQAIADYEAAHAPEPEPEPEPLADEATDDERAPLPPPRHGPEEDEPGRFGLPLLIGGAVVTAAGVATITAGPLVVVWGNSQYTPEVRANPYDEDVQRFVAAREFDRRVLIGVGIPVTVAGAIALGWGIVRYRKERSREQARVRVGPGPSLTSLSILGRF